MEPPLTRAARPGKFGVPSLSSDLLVRQRLVDYIHANVHRKLVLLSAAAGYGKSALAAQFAHDTDHAVAWCRLDELDQDLVSFVGDLYTALRRLLPRLPAGPEISPNGQTPSPETLALGLNHQLEAAADDVFVLVLENLHVVQDSPAICQFLDVLLDYLPEPAHLLITSRSVPNLNTLALTAGQQMAGLGERQLRFTTDELQALLALRQQTPLPAGEAEALIARTEGWITGILLTTQFFWDEGLAASLLDSPAPSDRKLYDYLAAEVLDRQPLPLQPFLLESAVLPEMDAGMCDVILERRDSARLLADIAARRLFVEVVGSAGEPVSYHYHHLFRDFLSTRLATRDPERLRQIQRRAAEWYAHHQDMPEMALNFWLSAGDQESAARLAEDEAEHLFLSSRVSTLRDWARALAATGAATPRLTLYLAKVETDQGELEAAAAHLAEAEHGFGLSQNRWGQIETDIQRAIVLYREGRFAAARATAQRTLPAALEIGRTVAAARAWRWIGLSEFALNEPQAGASLERAVELLTGQPAYRYDLGLTLNDLALVLRKRGATGPAARVQQQALDLWRALKVPAPLAVTLNNLGWDMHMVGQYRIAHTTYAEAYRWAVQAELPRVEANILTGQGDLFLDLAQPGEAAAYYERAWALAEQAHDWAISVYILRSMARLARAQGNLVGALELLNRAVKLAGAGAGAAPLSNLDSLQGILEVELGHVAAGRDRLRAVSRQLEASSDAVDQAQSLLFLACAEHRAGNPGAARQALARAFSVAERVGYIQMLVGEARTADELFGALQTDSDLARPIKLLTLQVESAAELGREMVSGRPASLALQAPPAPLEVKALGASKIILAGEEVPRPDQENRLSRELLLYVLDRGSVPRELILETFWPDKPPARAGENLRQVLFRLRRALGRKILVLAEAELRMDGSIPVDYDVPRFEAEAQAALALEPRDLKRPPLLARALELYTGEYLTDLPVEWAAARRAQLRELHLAVLTAYADELLNLTCYSDAHQWLARAIEIEPLRDDLHERMLICLAGLGWRHAIAQHYRQYCDLLRTELGLDPSLQLRNLYASLLT